MHGSDRRFRCCSQGGIARPIGQGVGRRHRQQIRCPVAPADSGTTSVAAGKKTPRQDIRPSSITEPSELIARYESIRPATGNGPESPSYASVVLLHQGVTGWLAFVRRQAEGSIVFQVMSTASVPRRPEVVCVWLPLFPIVSEVSHDYHGSDYRRPLETQCLIVRPPVDALSNGAESRESRTPIRLSEASTELGLAPRPDRDFG